MDKMVSKKTKLKIFFLWIIIGIILTTSLTFVLAATDTNDVDDVFQLNERIDYKKPCFNNGTYCSGSATCNYTIYNPDNTLLVDNQQGTNQGAYHNISFSVTNIGIYQVDMTCVDSGRNGAETLYFEVTGSGFNNTFGFYALILVFSIGIMVLGFWKQDAPIVILGSFGLYFLGIYILFYGLGGIKDPVYTWGSGLIVLAIAFYISARSSYELIVG